MSSDPVYAYFEEMLKRESGLVVTSDKSYLLESRILPVAFKHGLDGLSGVALKLKQANDPELLREVVEAMAAADTAFFRDHVPFVRLKEHILPLLLQARADTKKLRIWSAACASGQEPYSVAILLKEYQPVLEGWEVEIVATDLSHEILESAQEASYTQLEAQRGLPARCLLKYFTQDGPKWNLNDDVKDMVRFSQGNLLDDLSHLGTFDIILCRNVLSNFDAPTRAKVIKALRAALRPSGVLFLGIAETPTGMEAAFDEIEDAPGVFRAKD